MRACFALALLPLLASCGGGGNGSGGAVAIVTTPAATPTPTPTSTTTPISMSAPAGTGTPTPTPASTPTDFTARAAALYATPPSIAGCQPGQLTGAATAAALQSLNAIRALHRLPPVAYSTADEPGAQQAALMQVANDQLSHTPPTTWRCYSAAGSAASASSNLYAGFGNGLTFQTDDEIMAGWLTETNNITADNVGHRRWLLSPFLGAVAYGRVVGASPTQTRGDAAALKVFNNAGSGVAGGTLPAFVAYPFEDYPARFFNTASLLSFGVIASTTNGQANAQVDFAHATVTVRQRGGAACTVSKLSYDNQGYGLPNNLQWAVAGLQAGTFYDVTIEGVVVGGQTRSYTYYFRVVS